MTKVFNDYKPGDHIRIIVKMPTGNHLDIRDVPGYGAATIDAGQLKKYVQRQDETALKIIKKYANGSFGGHWWEVGLDIDDATLHVAVIPSNIFELYEDDFSNLDLTLDI